MKYILLFLLSASILLAAELPKDLKKDGETRYLVRLKTGDVLTGFIVDFENDADRGEAIQLQTILGDPIIYADEIAEIREYYENYRHKHRVFMMPTAEPIGDDHFVGLFEIGLLYTGFGIYDIVSITAGRSLIPGVDGRQQLSLINGKVTLLNEEWENYPGGLSLALGANYAWVNHNNRMVHYYSSATFHGDRTYLTLNLSYKAGSKDFYQLRLGNNQYNFNYQDGNFGLAFGIDTKFTEWHDMRFIGEVWNIWHRGIDFAPSLGLFAGLRVGNSDLSADFGLSFFSGPVLVPFTSFSWTPF